MADECRFLFPSSLAKKECNSKVERLKSRLSLGFGYDSSYNSITPEYAL